MHFNGGGAIFSERMSNGLPIAHGDKRTWTIHSLREWGSALLSGRGFEESHLHAELLLAHVLGTSRAQLAISREREVAAADVASFSEVMARRLSHEPLQYIVGETEFMGIPITVDPRVLIPRPETESLVERVLEWIRGRNNRPLRVLDIGTGSGCIAVALARFVPTCEITALDISSDALQVAAMNLGRHALKTVTLVQGDVFEDQLPGSTFDCIVSNPPYVPADEFERLQPEVRDFEPPFATTDGADGLRFARRIADFAVEHLVEGGSLFMEIGYGMSRPVSDIVSGAGLACVTISSDLAGIERVVSAVRPGRG